MDTETLLKSLIARKRAIQKLAEKREVQQLDKKLAVKEHKAKQPKANSTDATARKKIDCSQLPHSSSLK